MKPNVLSPLLYVAKHCSAYLGHNWLSVQKSFCKYCIGIYWYFFYTWLEIGLLMDQWLVVMIPARSLAPGGGCRIRWQLLLLVTLIPRCWWVRMATCQQHRLACCPVTSYNHIVGHASVFVCCLRQSLCLPVCLTVSFCQSLIFFSSLGQYIVFLSFS